MTSSQARPRVGGGPWYAGRALRTLGDDAVLFAKCGDADRAQLQRSLAAIGLPASLSTGGETTTFSFSYDADGVRTMTVDVVGEPWQLDEPPSGLLRRVESLQVAPLLRSDFDAAVLERLGSGRRLLLDAQGLVRVPKTGPLTLDNDFDPDVLRHVSILKVSEEEAERARGRRPRRTRRPRRPRDRAHARPPGLRRDRERARGGDSGSAGR